MLFEINCAFQLFVSRPLDPETHVLKADGPTFYERFRNGTLKDAFNLPVFQSTEYNSFRTQVYNAEKDHYDMDAILSKPSPDALKNAINECLVLAIHMMNNTPQNGLQAINQKSNQQLNQLESIIVCVVLPLGSNHGMDPIFAVAEPYSRAMPGNHLATTDVPSRKRAPAIGTSPEWYNL
jgi:hypothetical protein